MRLGLFLIPIVVIGLWVRARLKAANENGSNENGSSENGSSESGAEEGAADAGGDGIDAPLTVFDKVMLRRLAMALGAMAVLALGLYFGDSSRDEAGKVFIPPHVDGGAVVPGRFVPADSEEAAEARRKGQLPTDSTGGGDAAGQDG